MDQRKHRQNIQRILFTHIPFDFGIVSQWIPNGAKESKQKVSEPVLFTLFCYERVDRKQWSRRQDLPQFGAGPASQGRVDSLTCPSYAT